MTRRLRPHIPARPRALPFALALAAALILCALAAPPAPAKPLKRGDHGTTVKRLQHALHLRADGVFGAGTSRAVKRFQRRHHLHPDGIVGPATWRAIRGARGARRSSGGGVRVRSRGGTVRLLQHRLGIAADGVFGPGTSRAVKRFQGGHGMTADGVVGPATWAALGVRGHHAVLKRGGLPGRSTHPGTPPAVLRALAAANRIAGLPYRYGGGHGSFHDTAYDCSGSVSYVLHAAGRLSRPRDSSELMSYGAPGRGRLITIYANAGHAYMVIRGRRYDTTGRSENGTRWQGRARSSAGYVARHPVGL